jgi:CDP-paratose 2-epimerase
MLSTSRVYSIRTLSALPLVECETVVGGTSIRAPAFRPDSGQPFPPGATRNGIDEAFSTAVPISLCGATKLVCQVLAAEYAHAVGTPLIIDRCGVMAGAG